MLEENSEPSQPNWQVKELKSPPIELIPTIPKPESQQLNSATTSKTI